MIIYKKYFEGLKLWLINKTKQKKKKKFFLQTSQLGENVNNRNFILNYRNDCKNLISFKSTFLVILKNVYIHMCVSFDKL